MTFPLFIVSFLADSQQHRNSYFSVSIYGFIFPGSLAIVGLQTYEWRNKYASPYWNENIKERKKEKWQVPLCREEILQGKYKIAFLQTGA